eukprot:1888820-Pyramimonas_sp.AAC.1
MKSPTQTSVKIGRRPQSVCFSSAAMGLSAALQHAIEMSQSLSCWKYLVLLSTRARTLASSLNVSGAAESSAEETDAAVSAGWAAVVAPGVGARGCCAEDAEADSRAEGRSEPLSWAIGVCC